MTRPIEDLLAELTSRGWSVYSLHQNSDARPAHHRWECTLRFPGPPALIAFATGQTCADALAYAIDRMDRAEIEIPREIIAYDEPAIDLRAILNLRPTQINRRI